MSQIGDVMMALVFVALATTLVMHRYTASVINAGGNAFATSIKAAIGQG